MAETLISPGVLTRENDQSLVTTGTVSTGLAVVGPTVKGPVNIPTVVTSYSDYVNKFGGLFTSGGANYEYLTSITVNNYFQQGGESVLVARVANGAYTAASGNVISISSGSAYPSASFVLETLSVGTIMNNAGSEIGTGSLENGTVENVRWEIANSNPSTGTFTLLIRRGDDNSNSKVILETWSNLSLDPNANNYIEAVIGNQAFTPVSDNGNYYIQTSGAYTNKSRYVRVKSVNRPTPNYFNNDGSANSAYTGSLPVVASGSFGGATGAIFGYYNATGSVPLNMFDSIKTAVGTTSANNIQGILLSDYTIASNLLSNQDNYDFNILSTPGVNLQNGTSAITTLLSTVQDRGDAIYIIDSVSYGQNLATVTTQAAAQNSSYAATYWPWLQVVGPETGKLLWVPASVVMPAVYAFTDQVSAAWFAPAGINRGGLPGVVQAERRLSPTDRDTLYSNKVNPLATFPGTGVVAYGQKTLQTQATALDRVNVRRLLIDLKRYIGGISRQLVFEQNTAVTRNRFLNQVNPYLTTVQQRQGLFAFKVVMDDTNNTADVVDRNQLVGQVYLQPTKTAEFILIDFNITPTGASFPA
jgi:phage tail sheath protein FI